MNTWIMNLKDNREDKPSDLAQSKFDFCKSKGIIGIGWAGYDPLNADDTAFFQANNAIEAFEIGDLVWVKDPFTDDETQKHYICRVLSKAVSTNDEIMNKNDIGKYCTCEYIPIAELPDTLDPQSLTASHTIEKANGLVSEATEQYFNSINIESKKKKKKNKKKIILVLTSCIVILALIIALIPTGIRFFKQMLYPVLPNNLKFGMSYDEVSDIIPNISLGQYDTYTKGFSASYRIDNSNSQTKPEFRDDAAVLLSFNEESKLFKVTIMDGEKEHYDALCDYYEKAIGNKSVQGLGTLNYSTFTDKYTTCTINSITVAVDISSVLYEPYTPEISEAKINNAFNSINYRVNNFTINLRELINNCVSNGSITYRSAKEELLTEKDLNISGTDYSQYASTSYVVTVHGDISQNPSIPYLKTENIDVIKILLVFDSYGNLQNQKTLSECEELQRCAVLTMFG